MALETVEITVLSDDLSPEPVDNVVVRVYDETGTTLITAGSTGTSDDGEVQFTLNGDATPVRYQLRFYISGGSIASPQYIDVYSPASSAPTGANNFEIEAALFTLPTAVDSNLCRCSGYVVGPNGRPKKGIDIHFIPLDNPVVVADKAVLGERVAVKTDANGYVSVDLFRDGVYYATVEGHENIQREVTVPDRSSVNISHLLFPIVGAVSYDPAGPFTLAVDEDFDVVPTVITTAFTELDGVGDADVTYAIDDESVATVRVLSDRIVITGVSPGVTNLRVTRRDSSIVYVPEPTVVDGVIVVTVTA
jgi:hypothetical protein